MRMGRMVFTGQLIVSRGALAGQFADQSQAGKIIQDAVNGHLVYRTLGPDGVENLPGLPGSVLGPEDFQNPEAQRRRPETAPNQRRMEVAPILHMGKGKVFSTELQNIFEKKMTQVCDEKFWYRTAEGVGSTLELFKAVPHGPVSHPQTMKRG
jgi:hypothetical protein